MSTQIILPKLGNSVESSIITSWLKQPGDVIAEGDVLCSVETDKTTMEVPSTASGVLLQHLVNVGDDVPVLAPIAVIGEANEITNNQLTNQPITSNRQPISPRARKLAQAAGVDVNTITGSGPQGRIIERDVKARSAPSLAKVTPVAKAMLASSEFVAPERGSGRSGLVTKQDLIEAKSSIPVAAPLAQMQTQDADGTTKPMSGTRKIIAERMRASLQSMAQLTMNASADARALLGYRQRLKASDEKLGLREVTINDLVLFAVAKTLPNFPELNAMLQDNVLTKYPHAHLAFATDTPRGLLVPVIRNADGLSLRGLADAARALAASARDGKLTPDQLNGGTFTVSNLGQFGIESFTPIINAPQVAILGVGNVNLKPIEVDGEVKFIPHLSLSLTIDHQVIDGAPGAKFLQALVRNLAQFELLLAM